MESPPAGRVCTGMAELGGGWGSFSPPTFEEDDIFFVFVLVYVYFRLYPG